MIGNKHMTGILPTQKKHAKHEFRGSSEQIKLETHDGTELRGGGHGPLKNFR